MDFVLKKDEIYYPQVFLKVFRHIIDDLESSFDDSDDTGDPDEG